MKQTEEEAREQHTSITDSFTLRLAVRRRKRGRKGGEREGKWNGNGRKDWGCKGTVGVGREREGRK